ncbi:hypothetical protein FQZ97_803920 [compost metagenome]
MVVGVADLVLVAVGELALDPVAVIAAAVQLGAQQVAEAVAGLAPFVADQAQGLVDGVLAHRPVGVLLAGEGKRIAPGDLGQLAQHGNGLDGQRDDVRPARLHAGRRNGPGGRIKIELVPGRRAQLARADAGHQQQADSKARRDVTGGRCELFQQLGYLRQGYVRMMACAGRVGRYNVEVRGGVGGGHPLGQAEAENLVQPLADLAGGIQGAALLDLAHQVHQIWPGDLGHQAPANGRDDVVVQVQARLVRGRFGPAGRVVGVPLVGQDLEGVRLGLAGAFLRLLVRTGVDPFGHQRTRSITALAGLGEGDGRIGAQADHFRLAGEPVAEPPELGTGGRHLQAQAQGVGEAV